MDETEYYVGDLEYLKMREIIEAEDPVIQNTLLKLLLGAIIRQQRVQVKESVDQARTIIEELVDRALPRNEERPSEVSVAILYQRLISLLFSDALDVYIRPVIVHQLLNDALSASDVPNHVKKEQELLLNDAILLGILHSE
jgi:hypothetical protein